MQLGQKHATNQLKLKLSKKQLDINICENNNSDTKLKRRHTLNIYSNMEDILKVTSKTQSLEVIS